MGGEWGGGLAGRMWCMFFCSVGEVPPQAVICEWSWMEKLQGLGRVALQLPVQSEAPMPSITQHPGLLWPETEGEWERERLIFFPLFFLLLKWVLSVRLVVFGYQVTTRVTLNRRKCSEPPPRSQLEAPKSVLSLSFWKHHSIHASLTHWCPLQCFFRRDPRSSETVPVHLARLIYTHQVNPVTLHWTEACLPSN